VGIKFIDHRTQLIPPNSGHMKAPHDVKPSDKTTTRRRHVHLLPFHLRQAIYFPLQYAIHIYISGTYAPPYLNMVSINILKPNSQHGSDILSCIIMIFPLKKKIKNKNKRKILFKSLIKWYDLMNLHNGFSMNLFGSVRLRGLKVYF